MSTTKEKAMSGRWLLTVLAGICLVVFTVTDCILAVYGKSPVIDPMALLSVITIVVAFYFAKPPEVEGRQQEPKQ